MIIDSFPNSTELGGSGISVTGVPGSITVTETGLLATEVFGGSRETTLTLESLSGNFNANDGVNLKIAGGSNTLAEKADNGRQKHSDGLFELFYNGVTGTPAFPLDFSAVGAAILIDVHQHTNPDSNELTNFLVTLYNGNGDTATDTRQLSGGVSSSEVIMFDTFVPTTVFDFSSVVSIRIHVDPNQDTNISLQEISTTATIPDLIPTPTPEPSTAVLLLLGAAGIGTKRRMWRRKAASTEVAV